MTINEFLDRVPWEEMEYVDGAVPTRMVRHRENSLCPIGAAVVAEGHVSDPKGDEIRDMNENADELGCHHFDLDLDDAWKLMAAADADFISDNYRQSLRDEIERRMK